MKQQAENKGGTEAKTRQESKGHGGKEQTNLGKLARQSCEERCKGAAIFTAFAVGFARTSSQDSLKPSAKTDVAKVKLLCYDTE